MIKAISFDVGGTLITPYPSVGDIYAQVAQKYGVQADPALLNSQFKASWKKQSVSPTFDKLWWNNIVKETFTGYTIIPWKDFFEDLYATFEHPDAWRVFDDVHPILTDLKSKHFRLFVVSNWDERLPRLLEKLDLAKYFSGFSISYEQGIAKPDPRIFRPIIQSNHLKSDEILHIGDDARIDGEAAKGAHIAFRQIDRYHQSLADVLASM